jgi:hypothetical protein
VRGGVIGETRAFMGGFRGGGPRWNCRAGLLAKPAFLRPLWAVFAGAVRAGIAGRGYWVVGWGMEKQRVLGYDKMRKGE